MAELGPPPLLLFPPFASGLDYTTRANHSNGAQTLNLLTTTPLLVPAPCTIAQLGVGIGANVATAVVRLGIYADNGSGAPGSLIVEATGTVDASSGISTTKYLTIAQAVGAGLIHLAAVAQTAAANLYTNSGGLGNAPVGYYGMATGTIFSTNPGYWTQASVSGSLPATFTATPTVAATAIEVVAKIA